MAVNNLTVSIGASISGLQKGLDDASKKLAGFEKKVKGLADVGDQLTGIGKKLSLGLSAPLIAIGGLGVKMFSDFSQEMAKVKAISGATEEEFKTLEKSAKELGNSTRFSSSEVAGLQLNLSKLGFNPTAINNATASILDLAVATGEDLAQSAEVAASTLQGFGLTSEETARVADVMAKSFSSSALDLGKFGNAMSKIAPVAKATGIGLEESTALLSILSNAGLEASVSGTSLRNIFLTLAKEGLTLDQALDQINASTDKTTAAMDMFGTLGATAAIVLSDNVDEAKEFTKAYKGAAGSAEAMAKIMDDTLEGSLLSLKSAWEGVLITIGQILAPMVSKVAGVLNKVASAFNDLNPSMQKSIVIIGGIAAAIAPLMLAFGGVLKALPLVVSGMQGILGVIPAVISGVKALTAAMIANPYLALAAGLLAIGSALLIYTRNSRGAVDATRAINHARSEASISIAGEVSELQSLLKIASSEELSKEKRLEAIKKINSVSPEYLGNIDLETIKTGEASEAIEGYIKMINKQALEQVLASKRAALVVQKLELQTKAYKTGEASVLDYGKALVKSAAGDALGSTMALVDGVTNAREKEAEAIELQIKAIDDFALAQAKEVVTTTKVIETTNEAINARLKLAQIMGSGLSIDTPSNLGANGLINAFQRDNDLLEKSVEDRKLIFDKSKFDAEQWNQGIGGELSAIAEMGIENIIGDTFSAIGRSIAEGGDVLASLGGAAIAALGGIMQEFGSAMIAWGVAKIALDKLFSNPFTAIAAGAGLIALGAAISAGSAKAQKDISGVGSGGGGYSGGGNVSSGNGGNYKAPQTSSQATSTGVQRVVFEIEGTKLVGVLKRTMDRNSKLGGELAF